MLLKCSLKVFQDINYVQPLSDLQHRLGHKKSVNTVAHHLCEHGCPPLVGPDGSACDYSIDQTVA